MFDHCIKGWDGGLNFQAKTIWDVIFSSLAHREEKSDVIYGHLGEQLVSISLADLRNIVGSIVEKLRSQGLKSGDTVMLASFSGSNELANALIFTGASCSGIRVFVPIFPEPSEFENWRIRTDFSCVIMPWQEMLSQKGYEREKEVIHALQAKCKDANIAFLDSHRDFDIAGLIRNVPAIAKVQTLPPTELSPQTEAVIFTTSGTSGISKLVVYTHEGLVNSCQAWQQCGLFSKDIFGSPGFSPLFTHTIGIRTFINAVWSGHPFCLIVTDWFLRKPEVVRYLLLKMQIGHFIAGPAFYNTLLELFRQYPDLKTGIKKSLQAAISIGAPYDNATALKFKSATGITLMNGFGTTETLMISLNRPDGVGKSPPGNLGALLPGVTAGLKKTEYPAIYELYIKAIFQATRTIGEPSGREFFDTGDLVTLNENTGDIFFHSRKSSDFIKDEYGVKIPLNALRNYYGNLYHEAVWIEWVPLINKPGLGALIFIAPGRKGNPQKQITALIKNTNELLIKRIEPFEYAHRHLERIIVIQDAVPLTRKGTVSKDQLYKKYEQSFVDLRNPFVVNSDIEVTDTGNKNYLNKFSNPDMADLLEALRLDKTYTRGEGDYMYYQDEIGEHRVIDLVGGFGANLLGHNHPKIREAVGRFLESGYPALNNQGSLYYYPGLLAAELNRLFSDATGKYFRVQFGNSGTEATELALHHAYYEWRRKMEKIRDEQLQLYGAVSGLGAAEIWDRNMYLLDDTTPCLLVADHCFHGYTSGARSLLNQKKQRYLFAGLLRPRPLFISDQNSDWADQLKQHIRDNWVELQVLKTHNGVPGPEPVRFSTIIASVIEPVRGEGGIYEFNPLLADELAEQDFPLISDEIQCGLGRTGNLPAYKNAAYYLLGKCLGGGVEKISAVLIDDDHFKPDFTKYFNSTFANGELAACTGLATLRIIEGENLIEKAGVKGAQFLSMLEEIAIRFPDIIESVNGKGLMIGIHFSPQMGVENIILRALIEQEKLGYLFAGWLLNKHHIRVLPSLSKPNSLRIEPSFYVTETEMSAFCEALYELCTICAEKRLYELFKYLMNDDPYEDKLPPVFSGMFPQRIEEPSGHAIKVGFIGNFTAPHRELQVLEPDFLKASDTGLRILFNRLQILLEGKPFRIISKNLLNGRVHFTFYILPFDSAQMEVVSRWGKKRFYIARIQDAVNSLTKAGAACISLGAYTSIITGNGLNVAEREPCRILTGNSLTTASCLFYLNRYLEQTDDTASKPRTIAIVGANGNIGSGLAECLGDFKYASCEIILAGSNEKRLSKVRDNISAFNRQVTCTGDLFDLKHADIIVCSTNTNDPIIFPHHIRQDGPVLVIDISVPGAVSDEVKRLKNVVFCKEASSVYLPGDADILFSSHTPKGKIFCCAAESMLCALYDLQLSMKGHIQKETVRQLMEIAIGEDFFNQQ